jgi:hypothetical protein
MGVYNNTVKLKNCRIFLEMFSSVVRVEFLVALSAVLNFSKGGCDVQGI